MMRSNLKQAGASALLAAAVVGCGGNAGSPQAVAQRIVSDFTSGNFPDICNYELPDQQAHCRSFASDPGEAGLKAETAQLHYSVGSTTVHGNTATTEMTATTASGIKKSGPFVLERVGGKWYSKDTVLTHSSTTSHTGSPSSP